jgi:hypothetical protein
MLALEAWRRLPLEFIFKAAFKLVHRVARVAKRPGKAPVKKRKKKNLDPAKEARRRARNAGIAPATTRVIADKRKRAPKHKKQWIETEAG